MQRFIVILSLCAFIFALGPRTLLAAGVESKDYPPLYFDQAVDHTGGVTTTFKQKYYKNADYFTDPSGPIILYINGESPVSGPPAADTDTVVVLAKKLGALIVTLEHRYYGESNPTPDLSTKNILYLTTRQALADLAAFRDFIQKEVNLERYALNGEETLDGDNAWFSIGGSYSGALSAWFRDKYSDKTKGSISSSGVVEAILEFTDFDKQIATSAGEKCAAALRQITSQMEGMLFDPAKKPALLKQFNAEKLTTDDFLYFFADAQAIPIQYGHKNELCDSITVPGDVLYHFANFTREVFFKKLDVRAPNDYSSIHMTNVTPPNPDRSWWWQKCSELAYFQVAPAAGSIRSEKVDLAYHLRRCKTVFGVDIHPQVDETNAYYGGNDPKYTKVYFANGSQDPWQWASVRETKGETLPARIMNCEFCGHCHDLRVDPRDPPEVVADRELEMDYVVSWINK